MHKKGRKPLVIDLKCFVFIILGERKSSFLIHLFIKINFRYLHFLSRSEMNIALKIDMNNYNISTTHSGKITKYLFWLTDPKKTRFCKHRKLIKKIIMVKLLFFITLQDPPLVLEER